MAKGKIVFFKKNGKPLFPVTRAEGVLYRGTTVAQKLDEHEQKIGGLRTDVDAINRLPEQEIIKIFDDSNGETEPVTVMNLQTLF